jgi:hypothetical protein
MVAVQVAEREAEPAFGAGALQLKDYPDLTHHASHQPLQTTTRLPAARDGVPGF